MPPSLEKKPIESLRESFLQVRSHVEALYQRPYVILKWAETKDKFFAPLNGTSRWISSPESKALTHQWRTEEDAILVGYRTALIDNPALTARLAQGKNPLRVVIDPKGTLPPSLTLFTDGNRTLVASSVPPSKETSNRVGWEEIPASTQFIPELLHRLYKRGIRSLIVEGGAKTLIQFIEKSLWDEARIFSGAESWGSGIPAPHLAAPPLAVYEVGCDTVTIKART